MDLLNMLMGGMTSESSMSALTQKAGGSSDQISGLISAALPMLMNSVSQNASTQDGAASLLNALSQHTSTASVEEQIADADEEDGVKIINHILGGNTQSSLGALASQSGLDLGQVTSILGTIAPALMSGLSSSLASSAGKTGKVDLSDGIDIKDVSGLLGAVLGASPASGKEEKTGGLGSILGTLTSFLK